MNPQEDNMQLPKVQKSTQLTPASLPDNSAQVNAGIPDFSSQPQTPTPAQQATAGPSTTSLSAEDVDLIEKAWVEKAKDIVKGTMGNPHAQSEEINKIRADYIKKRYNKEIKAVE
jgi:hypothetical protein